VEIDPPPSGALVWRAERDVDLWAMIHRLLLRWIVVVALIHEKQQHASTKDDIVEKSSR
jgi:hypothetical protein